MTTYGTFSAQTTGSATIGAESSAVPLKIAGPARIKRIKVVNLLATGLLIGVRVDFPGIKSPQSYLSNETGALEGTEVGSGKIATRPIEVDIPVPANVSEVNLYASFTVASQTFWIGIEYEAS